MIKNYVVLILALFLVGCASNDYQYGVGGQNDIDAPLAPKMKQQIIISKPSWFLDHSDYIWPGSWLGKIILWNKDLDGHTVSDETIHAVEEYLKDNDLDHVQVYVNTYSVPGQWSRLFSNRTVGGGWRYTLGIASLVGYTILPGRFFGGDHYNPYNNTINIYSDDVAIALHEAGHAKASNKQKYKGLHAFTYIIPPAALYFEANASNDAISYMKDKGMIADQKEAYKTLHPAYGTYATGWNSKYWWSSIPGAMVGHITGNIAAAFTKVPKDSASVEEGRDSTDSSDFIDNKDEAPLNPVPGSNDVDAVEDLEGSEIVGE